MATQDPTQPIQTQPAPVDQQAPATAQALTQPSQDNSAPVQPQPAMASNQGAVTPQQPPVPKGVSPNDPNATHPSVMRAGVLHTIAQALAGGPRTRTIIDPNTGTAVREEVPLSTKDIGMAIALEAIGGALRGYSVPNGPGNLGRAAGAAGEDAMNQQLQAKQQQEQQASVDAARVYQTMEANMRMKNLAISTGKLDLDNHLALVKASEQQLAHLADGESLAASNVSERDAQDLQKYPITDYYRLPDGVIPRRDADGNQVYTNSAGRIVTANDPGATPAYDNTYSIVHRDAKVPVADENGPVSSIRSSVDWGLLPGNWLKAAPNATMPGAALASLSHRTQILEQAQNDIASNFTPQGQQPFDLKALVRQNPQLVSKAFDSFQAALQATPSGHNYGEAIDHLTKTNPDQAGLVLQAYGGRDALNAFDRQTAHTDRIADLRLNGVPDDKTAQQILSAPGSYSPDVVQAAKNFQQNQVAQKANAAGAEARAKFPFSAEARERATGGSGSDTVQQLGESIVSGNGTLDQISDKKTKTAVEAYLSQHHPNLDRSSVTLDADSRKKKQLADSVNLNLGIVQDVLNRRPDLVGPVDSMLTRGENFVGNNDKDLARLGVALDNYGQAAVGIHGSRSYQNKEQAAHQLLNGYRNGAQAGLAAVDAARQSASVFANAGKPRSVNGSAYVVLPKPQPGQTIDAPTVQKYLQKYGSPQAARAAAQKDGWALPGSQGAK
jgi:hypothetical protein